ncbi:MAG: TIGR04086 family membrane protein [Ruminococcaceae bacterium]|nr:TIGR04086 family membrane protein [Oscillospiraceae bacterium]
MNKSLFLSAVKGLGVGLLITLVLLLVGNLIALKTPDPDTVASLMAHGIRILAGFATGFAAARFQRERGLVTGITAGALYTAVLALGAAFMAGDFSFLSALLLCLAVIAASAVGGVAGLPGEKSGAAKRKAMLKRMG